MRPWFYLCAILTALSISSNTYANTCTQFYTRHHEASILAHLASHGIEARAPSTSSLNRQQLRGYAVLVGTMIGSAALSTYVTAELPKNMTFLSQLVGQVATIGIYVFGAPIWEPISSKFRKIAFGLKNDTVAPVATDNALEKLWQKTQNNYSLNAQMSRNVVNSLLLAIQNQFHHARIAIHTGDKELVSDLMAEAAVRMRQLFAEVDPDDSAVALVAQSSFTRHVQNKSEIKELIWIKIQAFDDEARTNAGRVYYQALISSWFKENIQ
tara:strand:- start:12763 stop:13569 length:807 start_codon:yes stop_codon:yes gene_type:complete